MLNIIRFQSKNFTKITNKQFGTSIPVVLIQDLENTGMRGDVVSVERGFARIFLIPRKIAMYGAHSNHALAFRMQTRFNHTVSERDSSILTDKFGRFHNYLRISVTERCNLRCVYCMPEDGVTLSEPDKLLTIEEQKRLVTIFASLGVTKIRITGGEPTVYKHLIELIQHCKSIPTITTIGLTTNGMKLKTSIDGLIAAGLNSINISMDTLIPEKFEQISRRDKKGLSLLISNIYKVYSKYADVLKMKINFVAVRGLNDMEIGSFIRFISEINKIEEGDLNDASPNSVPSLPLRQPIDLRFIEMMPFDSNNWDEKKLITYHEIIDMMKRENVTLVPGKRKLIKRCPLPENSTDSSDTYKDDNSNTVTKQRYHVADDLDRNDTTKWYHVPQSYGNIGFITSMSNNFCSTCNRLRITADGQLKVCLFDGSDNGIDFIKLFRDGKSDAEIIEMISNGVKQKKHSLGGNATSSAIAHHKNRPMILIGG